QSGERKQDDVDELNLEREAEQNSRKNLRDGPLRLPHNQQQAKRSDSGRQGGNFEHARRTQLNEPGRRDQQRSRQGGHQQAAQPEADDEDSREQESSEHR